MGSGGWGGGVPGGGCGLGCGGVSGRASFRLFGSELNLKERERDLR